MLRRMTSSRKTNESARLRRQGLGNRDEARQHARHLDAGELGAAAVLDPHGQVHAEVRDVRERVARVERQRRQDREDVRVEVLLQPLIHRRRVVGRLDEVDALGGQQRPQRVRPARRLQIHLLERPLPDRGQLLLGVQPVDRHVVDVGAELLQDGRDPHHEELVEVRRRDREELHALEQRVIGVLRLGEHPLVEFEPTELSIYIERGRTRGRRCPLTTNRRRARAVDGFRRFVRARGRVCERWTQQSAGTEPGGKLTVRRERGYCHAGSTEHSKLR